jgi:hypothetical protein
LNARKVYFSTFLCLADPLGNARPNRASIQLRLPSGVEITTNTPALLFSAISLLIPQHASNRDHQPLLCVICIFLLFGGQVLIAEAVFGTSLALMIVSLLLSLREIWISVDALEVHLRDIQEGKASP